MKDLAHVLGVQALDESELDALVTWATQRAAALTAELHDDPELGPLLRGLEEPGSEDELGLAVSADDGSEDEHEDENEDENDIEDIEEVELLDEDDFELVEDSLRARATSALESPGQEIDLSDLDD